MCDIVRMAYGGITLAGKPRGVGCLPFLRGLDAGGVAALPRASGWELQLGLTPWPPRASIALDGSMLGEVLF